MKSEKIDSRALAALLSSLISQLLLIILIFPSSDLTIPNSNSNSNSNSYESIFSLIHHFLSSSEIMASFSLLSISRKRKRTHLLDPDVTDDGEDPGSELGQLAGFDSFIPRGPDSFKLCFRMSSSTFEWLAALLEPLLECRDPVGLPLNLPAETRLGIGLYRLTTGACFPEISRRFRVPEPVAKFCVKQFCRVLCTNFRFWVGFPNPKELQSVSIAFESLTGMPNCCGIIDCTRFKIAADNTNHDESIAAQIVVDSSSRILSIFAGFRGEKSNSRVLKSSSLYKDIEQGNLLDSPPIYMNGVAIPQYLIGSREYPLLPWLQVPFVDPMPASNEANFNLAHHEMSLLALRAIASLKNWGILKKPIEAEFKTAVAYIGACSILHNVLIMREDYSALSDGLIDRSTDDGSVDDHSSEFHRNSRIEESSFEKKAWEIRSTLARTAKEIGNSGQTMDPGSSEQL